MLNLTTEELLRRRDRCSVMLAGLAVVITSPAATSDQLNRAAAGLKEITIFIDATDAELERRRATIVASN